MKMIKGKEPAIHDCGFYCSVKEKRDISFIQNQAQTAKIYFVTKDVA